MSIEKELKHKIDFKTKPLGALGKLEDIALKIGTIQNTLTPSIEKPTIIVFAADHGLADEKISPFPKDVTWQMVMNFVGGGAAINVFCKQNGISLEVVDAGVDYDFPAGIPVHSKKIGRGTKNMTTSPAMSAEECEKALAIGTELVKEQTAKGCNTIAFGEMGIGNTSSAALLMHKITGVAIDDCVGRGAGMDDMQLEYKKSVLASIASKYTTNNAKEILATFGGFEIAMMTGAYCEAAKQGMVILVDGFISTSALLVASKLAPEVLKNCIFCHTSHESGHKKMIDYLEGNGILNLQMRLGEGTGAAVALPLVKSAVNFLNEMASFEDAGVSNKE